MVLGWGYSIGTTTGLLLRNILCKSLVLMPRVKFVEKCRNMHAEKTAVKEFESDTSNTSVKLNAIDIKTSFTYTHC